MLTTSISYFWKVIWVRLVWAEYYVIYFITHSYIYIYIFDKVNVHLRKHQNGLARYEKGWEKRDKNSFVDEFRRNLRKKKKDDRILQKRITHITYAKYENSWKRIYCDLRRIKYSTADWPYLDTSKVKIEK